MVHVKDFRANCIQDLKINDTIVCYKQKQYAVRMCEGGGKRNYGIEAEPINTEDKCIILTEEEFNAHFRPLSQDAKEDTLKHGHWLWNDDDECWICDQCGASALNNYRGNSADSQYCPHCGLKMYETEAQINEI